MKLRTKFLISFSLISIFAFIVFTVLVKTVDVKIFSATSQDIGFSKFNIKFFTKYGYNKKLYKTSNFLGYVAIMLAVLFAIIGITQCIKRKSILKADKEYYVLCGLYLVTLIIYVFFEKVIINYRPIIFDKLEASYPSSHTILSCVILGSGAYLISKWFNNKVYKIISIVVCSLFMALIVLLRLFSGVHWCTDILAGLILSIFLVLSFYSVISYLEDLKEQNKEKSLKSRKNFKK